LSNTRIVIARIPRAKEKMRWGCSNPKLYVRIRNIIKTIA
jgi:hypothetical protein